MAHVPYIDYRQYLANVTIAATENGSGLIAEPGKFLWVSYHNQFVLFEIFFRLILLFLSLAVCLHFSFKLRKIHPYDWSVEQKWLWVLLISLVGFNGVCRLHSSPRKKH